MSLVLLGILLMVASATLLIAGELRENWRGSLGNFGFALGVMFVLIAMVLQARERVDQVWLEFDTHVRHCQCMTREWDIEKDGQR